MYIVEKHSAPGWEKKFDSYEEALEQLKSCICNSCKKSGWKVDEYDLGHELLLEYEEINENHVSDLLTTPCGCEYGFTWSKA